MFQHTSVTRRSVLAGACVACTAAVAGCAGYGKGNAPAAPPPPPASGGAAGSGAKAALVSTADVPVGGGVILAAQKIVITQPTPGTFKAFDSTCTHQGCTVNEVTGGTINCPCHGSMYRVADGSVAGGPAPRPLPPKQIKVQGTTISLA